MRKVNKRSLLSLALAIVAAALMPSAAHATQTFNISSTKIDPTVGGLIGSLHYTYKSGSKTKKFSETAWVGRLQLAGTENGKPVVLDSYCVDIFDVLKPGTFKSAGLDALNLTPLRLSQLTTFLENADALVTSKKSKVYSAAAQLGVWEILYETDKTFDLTKGAFYANGGNLNGWGYSATQLANSWLSNVTNNVWKPIPGTELALVTPGRGNQPQIYVRPLPQTSAVPEPASWITMIVGFGALGVGFRRHRRTVAELNSAAVAS